MKSREIHEMTTEDILNALEDKKEALFHTRLNRASGQLEDTTEPRRTRRIIARLKTELRQRELAAQVAKKEANDGK